MTRREWNVRMVFEVVRSSDEGTEDVGPTHGGLVFDDLRVRLGEQKFGFAAAVLEFDEQDRLIVQGVSTTDVYPDALDCVRNSVTGALLGLGMVVPDIVGAQAYLVEKRTDA